MDRGILSDDVTHARRHPAYPELAGLGAALGSRPAVLDGEVVALDGEGRSDFERLQSRMGLAGSPAKAARRATKIPAHLMLFDIVFLDAHDLTRSPYAVRRAPHHPGIPGTGRCRLVDSGRGHRPRTASTGHDPDRRPRRSHRQAPHLALRAECPVQGGSRSGTCGQRTSAAGWLVGHGWLTSLPGALLMGQPGPDGRLRCVVNVGTGCSDPAKTVLPSQVADTVQNARDRGWAPETPGPPFQLDQSEGFISSHKKR